MRTPSAVIYGNDFTFDFGKGYVVRETPNDSAYLISSGRGVHEALAAAELCARSGVNVRVIDMPSIDEEMLLDLVNSGKLLVFAEQNNGYIWENSLKVVYANRNRCASGKPEQNRHDQYAGHKRPASVHSFRNI